MTTHVHSVATFEIPEEALREGTEQFETELREHVEFRFDIPTEATIDVVETTDEESGETVTQARVDVEFQVPDETVEADGTETVVGILEDDLESIFQVPVTIESELEDD